MVQRLVHSQVAGKPSSQGPLSLQKYWRKVWALLYAGGPSGVARLESWDVRDGGLGPAGDRSVGPGRRGERRVIRLADCVSVLPADGENCPRDTGAFLITTTERSHLLAAQHRQSWMGPICQLAFPVSVK